LLILEIFQAFPISNNYVIGNYNRPFFNAFNLDLRWIDLKRAR
jgi:hypothetical protein